MLTRGASPTCCLRRPTPRSARKSQTINCFFTLNIILTSFNNTQISFVSKSTASYLLVIMVTKNTFFVVKNGQNFANYFLNYHFRASYEMCCCNPLFCWFPKNKCTKFDLNWSNGSRKICVLYENGIHLS